MCTAAEYRLMHVTLQVLRWCSVNHPPCYNVRLQRSGSTPRRFYGSTYTMTTIESTSCNSQRSSSKAEIDILLCCCCRNWILKISLQFLVLQHNAYAVSTCSWVYAISRCLSSQARVLLKWLNGSSCFWYRFFTGFDTVF